MITLVLGLLIIICPYVYVVRTNSITWDSAITSFEYHNAPVSLILSHVLPFVAILLLPVLALMAKSFTGKLFAMILLVVALAYTYLMLYLSYSLDTIYIRKIGSVKIVAGPALYLQVAAIVLVIAALVLLLIKRRQELANA
ncbi:MAG: hypothetical protein M0D57_05880 [Sphingobacteriales bacterium JAD_PAG50586_3]|nr:MAG: hypothetical protein M0D57_05880 [Sphingobacteriales bacterium JAD_PAG50586_3]